jgi:hypothetical protein
MEELYCFENIPETPAWYYKRFPGFYNVDCYRILAAWKHGCRTPEQVAVDNARQQDSLRSMDPRKRKFENKNDDGEAEIEDNGVHTEF